MIKSEDCQLKQSLFHLNFPKKTEPRGRGRSLIAVSRPASLTLSDGRGEDRWGGGGWVEGVPLLSPGPREPAISFNLSICSIGNVRMRDFANSIPRAYVIFLFTPKRSALFDLTF